MFVIVMCPFCSYLGKLLIVTGELKLWEVYYNNNLNYYFYNGFCFFFGIRTSILRISEG